MDNLKKTLKEEEIATVSGGRGEQRDWQREAIEQAQRNNFLSGRGGSYPGPRGGSGSSGGSGTKVKINTAKGAGYVGKGGHISVSKTF